VVEEVTEAAMDTKDGASEIASPVKIDIFYREFDNS
jgi:hypothetical protein